MMQKPSLTKRFKCLKVRIKNWRNYRAHFKDKDKNLTISRKIRRVKFNQGVIWICSDSKLWVNSIILKLQTLIVLRYKISLKVTSDPLLTSFRLWKRINLLFSLSLRSWSSSQFSRNQLRKTTHPMLDRGSWVIQPSRMRHFSTLTNLKWPSKSKHLFKRRNSNKWSPRRKKTRVIL